MGEICFRPHWLCSVQGVVCSKQIVCFSARAQWISRQKNILKPFCFSKLGSDNCLNIHSCLLRIIKMISKVYSDCDERLNTEDDCTQRAWNVYLKTVEHEQKLVDVWAQQPIRRLSSLALSINCVSDWLEKFLALTFTVTRPCSQEPNIERISLKMPRSNLYRFAIWHKLHRIRIRMCTFFKVLLAMLSSLQTRRRLKLVITFILGLIIC